MENPSITGLVASCTSLFRLAMIFNILPCVSVDTLMPQQNLISLLSYMTWNISCTIPMNLLFIQERKLTEQMKSHIDVSSNQGIHKSTKIINTPTSSTYIVMQIMQEIYLKDALSHQHLTSSMVPSFTSVTRKNMRPIESVPMQKQEQCKQEC